MLKRRPAITFRDADDSVIIRLITLCANDEQERVKIRIASD